MKKFAERLSAALLKRSLHFAIASVGMTLFILFHFSTISSAHMPGQPAFFMVNGKYADYHPDYNINNPNPDAPHDIAPEQYRVNQPITFAIDFSKFPQVTPEQIKNTKFYWKYGDGDLANGSKNTHVYKKPGKYVLRIHADDGTAPEPQLFESVEVTVLPDEQSAQNITYAAIGAIILFIAGGIVGGIMLKRTK